MTQDEEAKDPHQGASPLVHDTLGTQKLGKQARQRIGVHLRAMYDTVVQQPIPSRFSDLIAQLDDAQGSPASDDA